MLECHHDERVLTVDDIEADTALIRELTARELALLDQSKANIAAGRAYSIDEVRAHTNELIKTLRTNSAAT